MSNYADKPKKFSADIVGMMKKQKGVNFNIMSDSEAVDYLHFHNNYMRVAAYRKNYDKHPNGFNRGKYIDLDFAYLVELSTIDMHIRFLVLKMCLDIEHDLKIDLINKVSENRSENGYDIVAEFLYSNHKIVNNISKISNSSYTSDLVDKYFELVYVINRDCTTLETHIKHIDCPAWVLVELLSFGDFLKFYEFYFQKYSNENPLVDFKILSSVRNLRNACAHNNCIIHNLRKGQSNPNEIISQYVSKIPSIKTQQRQKKLTSQPLYELVCLFYTYNAVVSHKIKIYRFEELRCLFYGRMHRHAGYFEKQGLIKSSYEFIKNIIDIL